MKKKILLVEDDKMLCTVFNMFLSELEVEVIGICQTGEEAINICKGIIPDVILTDIHLEGDIDGIELAKKIWNFADVPVVFISSDDDLNIIQKCKMKNSYGFLSKPIYKRALKNAIDFAYYKHQKFGH